MPSNEPLTYCLETKSSARLMARVTAGWMLAMQRNGSQKIVHLDAFLSLTVAVILPEVLVSGVQDFLKELDDVFPELAIYKQGRIQTSPGVEEGQWWCTFLWKVLGCRQGPEHIFHSLQAFYFLSRTTVEAKIIRDELFCWFLHASLYRGPTHQEITGSPTEYYRCLARDGWRAEVGELQKIGEAQDHQNLVSKSRLTRRLIQS